MPAKTIDPPILRVHPTRRVTLGEGKRRSIETRAESLLATPSKEELDERQAAMRTRRRPGTPIAPASAETPEAVERSPRSRAAPTDCAPPPKD